MPPHLHYVEPYAGGLSVLLAKNPDGISEVVNDIDKHLTNFWRVLQDEQSFLALKRILEAVPFSEVEWVDSKEFAEKLVEVNMHRGTLVDPTEHAIRFFIHCRQSLAGRMDTFAPLSKTRTRRGMNEQASAWLNAIEGLPEVHTRLKRVAILNRDALEVIERQDGPDTLFYLDPPYLGSTRASDDVYQHEMTSTQHAELLYTIKQCKGKVLLSGYSSQMYEERLASWHRHEFDMPNQAASGKQKRRMIEVVWCNF